MVYDHWKKRQATYKEYKDVMRSCRKTITKVKAQLELHLARKRQQKCFNK